MPIILHAGIDQCGAGHVFQPVQGRVFAQAKQYQRVGLEQGWIGDYNLMVLIGEPPQFSAGPPGVGVVRIDGRIQRPSVASTAGLTGGFSQMTVVVFD